MESIDEMTCSTQLLQQSILKIFPWRLQATESMLTSKNLKQEASSGDGVVELSVKFQRVTTNNIDVVPNLITYKMLQVCSFITKDLDNISAVKSYVGLQYSLTRKQTNTLNWDLNLFKMHSNICGFKKIQSQTSLLIRKQPFESSMKL